MKTSVEMEKTTDGLTKRPAALSRHLRHDLLAALGSILGFAEILLYRQLSKEDSNHYLKIIRDETQRMVGLVENVSEAGAEIEVRGLS